MAHDSLSEVIAPRGEAPPGSLAAEAPPEPLNQPLDQPLDQPVNRPLGQSLDHPLDRRAKAADVASAVERWQATLTAARLPDTLIGEDLGIEVLDLTHAHPSGLATLMAGRSTRLSSLVREPAAHVAARRRARAIAASAERLAAERGVRSAYLAAGLVTWSPVPGAAPGGGAATPISAPVLLRSCRLHPRGPAQDDYELDLDDTAVVNPEVVRRLATDHGIRLDPSGLGGLAFGVDGFDPRPVFSVLEEVCARVPGFAIDRRLVVGSFTSGSDALVADLDAARLALQIHPLLSRVANATPSMESDQLAAAPPYVPRVDDDQPLCWIDPEPETDDVAFDLDCSQRAAVDAALSGSNVLIEGPPGTGLTHTLAAAAGALAGRGRRVLVVTPHRGTADTLIRRFADAGLSDLVLDLHDGLGDRIKVLSGLEQALDAAIDDAKALESGSTPDRRSGSAVEHGQAAAGAEAVAAAQVRHAAEALAAAGKALHAKREPWAVSAYEAMVALAELMTGDTPPRTRVRLPHAVTRQLDAATRDRLREDLREVAELGAFRLTRLDTRWLDARVADEDEAHAALAAARAARTVLPAATSAMDALATASGIEAVDTLAQWRPQLDLLLGIRATLDVLQPAVFEQPLEDLVRATAQDPPDDGWLARRSLRRRARALVRPGTHLLDLHERLVTAQEQRTAWQQIAASGGWPRVPTGLDAANATVRELELAVGRLTEVLEGTGTPALDTLPTDKLRQRVGDLAADSEGLLAQPQRRVRMDRLRRAGLTPLIEDLTDRRCEASEVEGELDLAWWTSVLEAIIRSEPRLAAHDPAELRGHVETLRDGQNRLLQARAAQTVATCALRAVDAVRHHGDQVRWLLAEVHRGHRSSWPMDLFSYAGDLLAALRPIWVMSPDAVARNLPAARPGAPVVDVVAVDDASQVGMPEAAAALARAQQVIVAGDRLRLPPATGGPSVVAAVASLADGDHRLSVNRLDRDHRTRDGRLLLPLRPLYTRAWALVPGAPPVSPLTLEHVREGVGVPAPGEQVVVSAEAEVDRVVDLVSQHAARRPGESLLVVTLGARHAERIEEALRLEVAHRPELARWLDVHWAGDISEPFLVRPIHRIPGVERDAVIVSVGLARTPHGRVLHRFGVLDGRYGTSCLATALSRARRRTTLVCCFTADDLDGERLRSDGSKMLRDVLALAADPTARGDHPEQAQPVEQTDALVRDLRDRLESVGLPVTATPALPDWPMAIALADPQSPGRRLMAIEVDGPSFAACPSVATRDRQRRESLERAGWAYLRVAAMDLFCDPAGEVERIRRLWMDVGGAGPTTRPTQIIVGRPRVRSAQPAVAPGLPITEYSDAELEQVAGWVLSDGVHRSAEELAALVREALHLPRRGMHVEAAVGGAARRVLDGADTGQTGRPRLGPS